MNLNRIRIIQLSVQNFLNPECEGTSTDGIWYLRSNPSSTDILDVFIFNEAFRFDMATSTSLRQFMVVNIEF